VDYVADPTLALPPERFDLAEFLERVRPAWHARAACAGHGPDGYFSEDVRERQWVSRTCGSCPVTDECYAAGAEESFGIWGGVSRQVTWRQRRRQAQA